MGLNVGIAGSYSRDKKEVEIDPRWEELKKIKFN